MSHEAPNNPENPFESIYHKSVQLAANRSDLLQATSNMMVGGSLQDIDCVQLPLINQFGEGVDLYLPLLNLDDENVGNLDGAMLMTVGKPEEDTYLQVMRSTQGDWMYKINLNRKSWMPVTYHELKPDSQLMQRANPVFGTLDTFKEMPDSITDEQERLRVVEKEIQRENQKKAERLAAELEALRKIRNEDK